MTDYQRHVESLNYSGTRDLSTIEINHTITRHCNYHCWYCVQMKRNLLADYSDRDILLAAQKDSGSQHSITVSEIDAVLKQIKKIPRKVRLFIKGGEALLLRNELLYYLSSLNNVSNIDTVYLITNGSCDDNYLQEIFSAPKAYKFEWLWSIHYVILHSWSLSTLKNRIRKICKSPHTLRMRVMLSDKHLLLIKTFVEMCKLLLTEEKLSFRLMVDPVYKTGYDPEFFPYSSESLSFMKESNSLFPDFAFTTDTCFHTSEAIQHPETCNFKGKFCALGTSLVIIDSDGSITNSWCAQRTGSYDKNSFSIYKGFYPFRIPNFINTVQCSSRFCHCSPMRSIPKFVCKDDAVAFSKVINKELNTCLT